MSRKTRRSNSGNNGQGYRLTNREIREQMKDNINRAAWDRLAELEGPTKKKWSLHDIKNLKPLTENQTLAFHAFNTSEHLALTGSAGTGKTLLAMFFALRDVIDPAQPQQKVRIVRSSVSSRDIGFLPGDEEEKMAPYEAPYRGVCKFLFNNANTYDNMKEAGLVIFDSSSFARGDTWTNEIVILDEVQNMTFHEINTLATRLGENSRLILVGDGFQDDLQNNNGDSGFAQTMNVVKHIKSMQSVQFGIDDIVRSGFVKEWIIAVERLRKRSA